MNGGLYNTDIYEFSSDGVDCGRRKWAGGDSHAGGEFEYEDADSPDIDSMIVASVQYDLWCYVLGCAAERPRLLTGLYVLRKAKVNLTTNLIYCSPAHQPG